MPKITLVIKGLGHCPSFKNSKMICGLKQIKPNLWSGKPFLITQPKKKAWMDAAILSIASQLRSLCPTTAGATSTECLQRFLTACVPQDDCWQMIPQLSVMGEKTAKGNEGCVIEIERIE